MCKNDRNLNLMDSLYFLYRIENVRSILRYVWFGGIVNERKGKEKENRERDRRKRTKKGKECNKKITTFLTQDHWIEN